VTTDRTTTEAERQRALYTYLTPAEAGERMGGMSAATVLEHIRAGKIKAVPVSRPNAKRRRWRVAAEWIEEWLERETVNA
jgi:predicted site-specific integrase-resolvase